ncbi:MAG: tetratricopeptide repeat protein [Actinobacteria bacterium]|nr:tetratricopeptide repeat protein [Actinomycetota bacterium]
MDSIKRGDDEFAKGNWAEAEAAYKRALEEGTENTHTLLKLARTVYEQERYEEAKDLALKVLKQDKTLAEAHVILGRIAIVSKNLKSAENEFRIALEMDPKNEQAHIGLGSCLANLKRYDEALEILDKGISLYKHSPKLSYNIGVVYARKKEYETTVDYFIRALELSPDYADAAFALGFVFRKLKKYPDARPYAEKAEALRPDNYRYQFGLRLLDVKELGIRSARRLFREISEKSGRTLSRKQTSLFFWLAPPLGRLSYVLIPLVLIASFIALLMGAPLFMSGFGLFIIWLSFYRFWYHSKSSGWLVLGFGLLMIFYSIVYTLDPHWPGPIYIRFR